VRCAQTSRCVANCAQLTVGAQHNLTAPDLYSDENQVDVSLRREMVDSVTKRVKRCRQFGRWGARLTKSRRTLKSEMSHSDSKRAQPLREHERGRNGA